MFQEIVQNNFLDVQLFFFLRDFFLCEYFFLACQSLLIFSHSTTLIFERLDTVFCIFSWFYGRNSYELQQFLSIHDFMDEIQVNANSFHQFLTLQEIKIKCKWIPTVSLIHDFTNEIQINHQFTWLYKWSSSVHQFWKNSNECHQFSLIIDFTNEIQLNTNIFQHSMTLLLKFEWQ